MNNHAGYQIYPGEPGGRQREHQEKLVNLYMEKKEYAQAAKLLEEELIGQTLYIDAILLTLMKIALKEECLKGAQEIAAIHDEVQQLLGFRIEQPRLAQFSLACE